MLDKLDWNHFCTLSLFVRDDREGYFEQGRILERDLDKMPDDLAGAVRSALDDFNSVGFVREDESVGGGAKGYSLLQCGFDYAKKIFVQAQGVYECDVPENVRFCYVEESC